MHDLEHDLEQDSSLGDGTGFWDNMPESRLDRWRAQRAPRSTSGQRSSVARSIGGRQHRVDPVLDDADVTSGHSAPVRPVGAAAQRVRQATDHVDPLLRRTGAIAIVIAALVPVALSLRSSHSSAAALAPAATLVAPAASPATAAASTVALAKPTTAATAPQRAAAARTAKRHVSTGRTAVGHVARATQPAKRTIHVTHQASTATVAVAHIATRSVSTSAPAAVFTRSAVTTCNNTYRVVFGDAWIVIASKAHVSLSKLLDVNHANTSTPLYPGRKLCLPAGARVSRPAVTHTPTTVQRPATHNTVAPKPTYVPQRTYTRAQVEKIIRDVWPDSLEDHAVFIATRESDLVPTARNYCCEGLFQIYYSVHAHWLSQYGINSAEQLLDPRTNAYAALLLYNRSGGFGPWGG